MSASRRSSVHEQVKGSQTGALPRQQFDERLTHVRADSPPSVPRVMLVVTALFIIILFTIIALVERS